MTLFLISTHIACFVGGVVVGILIWKKVFGK